MLIPRKGTAAVFFPAALLLLLAAGCFVVLRPFLSAVLWAAILAYSTWPLYRHLHATLPRFATLTAALMTVAVAAVIVVPFVVVGSELVENSAPVINAVRTALEQGPPAPPAWIAEVPVIGPDLVDYLAQAAKDGTSLASHLREWVGPAQSLILQAARTIGSGLLGLALSVFILFFLYRDGTLIADHLLMSLTRLGGPTAIRLLAVAGSTIRGVVYGILGTALAQGTLAAIGFRLMEIPGALFLGFVTFFFSFLPMGPPFVWVPVLLWLVLEERFAAAAFLAVWGFVVISGVDNLLKPYLISRAGSLPFILVLLGAFGGVLTFGLIGVFIGPILLALGYNLILEWGGAEPVGGGG
jgi:predicted PurR-regulated permease PerM